jgi:hypothetical protein
MAVILRDFPRSRSAKTIEFLHLLTEVLAYVPTTDVKANMRKIFMLFAQCTAMANVKIAAASHPIWNRIELEPFIMDNAKTVFALVYPILQQAQRDSWSLEIVNTIDDIFRILNRIDSFVFQELCRQKPKIAQPAVVPVNDPLRVWAGIARSASHMDKALNLSEKLVEMQRVFFAAQGGHASPALGRPLKAGSLPVTTEKPLGVRSGMRPVIRVPVF